MLYKIIISNDERIYEIIVDSTGIMDAITHVRLQHPGYDIVLVVRVDKDGKVIE